MHKVESCFFLLLLPLIIHSKVHAQVASGTTLFTLLPPSETHVDFVNALTESETLNVVTYQYLYNGGGVAIGDLNNDGLADIYFAGNMTGDKLYLNKGNFEFEDISEKAGIAEISGWSTGVSFADVNADGLLDIYVCKSGMQPVDLRRNKLFINGGDLTFKDEAAMYGIDDPSFTTQAAFFDYDRDGDLDLFLLNHELYLQKNFKVDEIRKQRSKYGGNKLFRNDDQKYIDVSEAAGINGSPLNFGLGISIGDMNNDSWPDIFVTNDYQERDFLYINKGDGTFSEQLTTAFQHTAQFSMGTDLADINNDGWLDLFVADMLPADNYRQKLLRGPSRYDAYQLSVDYGLFHQSMRNMLQLNLGNGTFSEIGQYSNVFATDWSWAPLFADFDNDGIQDLFVTNGYRRDFTNMDFIRYTYAEEERIAGGQGKNINYYEVIQKMPSVKTANYIFKGTESLQFENKIIDWGFDQPSFSNGAAYGDLDNDGDLDLVVNNVDDTAFVYRNNAVEQLQNNFVRLQIKGNGKNTFAIGTKVTVYANNKKFTREVMPVRGYASSVDPVLVIGVGNADEVTISVDFPSGKNILIQNAETNKLLPVNEKNATEADHYDLTTPLFTDVTASHILDHTDNEENYIDFKHEVLLPHQLSSPGPPLAKGDLNGDHLEDIFIGGSKNKKARCYLQSDDGSFFPMLKAPWNADSAFEDVGILIFDAENDGDNDIYVVSGGNEYEVNSPYYQDRIYLNDGSGNFTSSNSSLPQIYTSKSCVRPADFDLDGDIDLFVGGKLIPGKYPLSPQSFLFENISSKETGTQFKEVTSTICHQLNNAGMVNDAQWADINHDKRPDLIIAGEWMQIRIFINTKKGFVEQTNEAGFTNTSGWWNCITATDIDNDGDMDLVAGNRGLNNQVKATPAYPADIYANDYDGNGTLDALMYYYLPSTHEPGSVMKSFPVASRDDLLDQLNKLKKKYVYYADYADATHDSIFQNVDLSKEVHLKTEQFSSAIFLNDGHGRFTMKMLPPQAQWFAVNCIIAKDVDRDGNLDLILAGNDLGMRPEIGRMDAGFGLLLKGDGKGGFRAATIRQSGIFIPGQARGMELIKIQNETYLVVTRNKLQTQVFLLNE